eukprot:SM000027S09651  [mRNA]  locus=s27:545678:551966:- [translate_table: standard]
MLSRARELTFLPALACAETMAERPALAPRRFLIGIKSTESGGQTVGFPGEAAELVGAVLRLLARPGDAVLALHVAERAPPPPPTPTGDVPSAAKGPYVRGLELGCRRLLTAAVEAGEKRKVKMHVMVRTGACACSALAEKARVLHATHVIVGTSCKAKLAESINESTRFLVGNVPPQCTVVVFQGNEVAYYSPGALMRWTAPAALEKDDDDFLQAELMRQSLGTSQGVSADSSAVRASAVEDGAAALALVPYWSKAPPRLPVSRASEAVAAQSSDAELTGHGGAALQGFKSNSSSEPEVGGHSPRTVLGDWSSGSDSEDGRSPTSTCSSEPGSRLSLDETGSADTEDVSCTGLDQAKPTNCRGAANAGSCTNQLQLSLIKELEACKTVLSTREYSLEQLIEATDDFASSNLLGTGGCGNVYKGTLPGDGPVAVKRMGKMAAGSVKQIMTEVEVFSRVRHKNLVHLRGYCLDRSHCSLVFDLFSRGSLYDNLHERQARLFIKNFWLYSSCLQVADFGLARWHGAAVDLLERAETFAGTVGLKHPLWKMLNGQLVNYDVSFIFEVILKAKGKYIAPECYLSGEVDEKADVYAFGVVLLELISGKLPVGSYNCSHISRSLVSWALPVIAFGHYELLVDARLEGQFDHVQLKRMVKAAELCVDSAPGNRPTMTQVVRMLEDPQPKLHRSTRSMQYRGSAGAGAADTDPKSRGPKLVKSQSNGPAMLHHLQLLSEDAGAEVASWGQNMVGRHAAAPAVASPPAMQDSDNDSSSEEDTAAGEERGRTRWWAPAEARRGAGPVTLER